jgi:3-methyladenine DNA glycosylase AlkD
MRYERIIDELRGLGSPEKAQQLSRFFKTGAGEYGEGDRFLGITMPVQREVVRRHAQEVSLHDIEQLVTHELHECRMVGLLLLIARYEKSRDEQQRDGYARWYVEHVQYVNSWDLVDVTCPRILGPWLADRDRTVLYELARADHLWSNRIAMITTLYFIKREDFTDTLRLADLLIDHRHDLMHKAVGWMLREVGKRDAACEKAFLKERYARMPRTMLRYAIERFPEEERKRYLHGNI